MENSNVNSTLQPLFEGSGNHVITSTNIVVTSVVNGTTGFQEFFNTTAATMKRSIISLEDGTDNTTLLQTNILLIAVLVVCFITFTSVIAMCVCFLRRYCKNRRISQTTRELYQTTLISKATSITGLHLSHEYFSTKIEKCDRKQNKGTDCELGLGVGRGVESSPNLATAQFDPISPVCYVPPEEAAPVYFRIKNAVTSTPTSTEQLHNHVNGVVDGKTDSLTENQHIIFSVASPPSIYTSALSNHNQHTPSTIHAEVVNTGTVNSGVPIRCLTKGPLTQSISWFVPLKGIQREPLRHSVVDICEDEVSVDQGADYEPKPREKKRKPIDAPLVEETDIILCDVEDEALCKASTTVAESVPLMNNMTKNQPFQNDDAKCSKERRLMSDNGQKNDQIVKDGLNRERSLSSPDEKTMWKQREDRPVLFLGPDSK